MAKGRKTGGRTKGTPNRVTGEVREVFKRILENLAPECEEWIRETAAGVEVERLDDQGQPIKARLPGDPGKAADLLIKLAEYHVPKLARTEVTGEGGGALVVELRDLSRPQPSGYALPADATDTTEGGNG